MITSPKSFQEIPRCTKTINLLLKSDSSRVSGPSVIPRQPLLDLHFHQLRLYRRQIPVDVHPSSALRGCLQLLPNHQQIVESLASE